MSNLDKLNSDLEKAFAPIHELTKAVERAIPPEVRALQNALDNLIPPEIKEFNQRINELIPPELKEFNKQFNDLIEPISKYVNQYNSLFQGFAENFEKWQAQNKVYVTDMVAQGWYPTPMSFYAKPKREFDLDLYMVEELTENWEELSEEIIELYPNRSHILRAAFALHEQRNYIASIPLFYAQADGICCEHFKSFLFAGNRVGDSLEDLEPDSMLEVFLTPYKLKNHHNAGISCKKSARIAPNRNGILHGHRKHLNYGTEVNSLKAFSLLCFVVMSVGLLKEK
ncbi:hypothetical protein [Vibrio harveyi]|uniref:hypothetical protein n=1 Tax=Vibrio harveyi TaxID=669 RepID=UPI003D71FE76